MPMGMYRDRKTICGGDKMKPINWELIMTFRDLNHYLKFMERFLVTEKKRDSLATEFHVQPDASDPRGEAVIMTIVCTWGSRLKGYARIMEIIEEEKG